MKITRKILEKLIKEEVEALLKEQNPEDDVFDDVFASNRRARERALQARRREAQQYRGKEINYTGEEPAIKELIDRVMVHGKRIKVLENHISELLLKSGFIDTQGAFGED